MFRKSSLASCIAAFALSCGQPQQIEDRPCLVICAELVDVCEIAAFPTRDSCVQGCEYDATEGADVASQWTCIQEAACETDYEDYFTPVQVDPNEVTTCEFEPISGTRLSRYACNPLIVPDERWSSGFTSTGFRADNVLGHPFYQMWYVSRTDDDPYGAYGLGTAVSDDGVTWTPHIANPGFESSPSGWDRSGMGGIEVTWYPPDQQYLLMYQGYEVDLSANYAAAGLGMMASFDGVSWYPVRDEPILPFGEFVGPVRYCWPLGLQWTQARGLTGLIAGADTIDGSCSIYGLTGTTPDNLIPGTTPLLTAGPQAYDQVAITSASIVDFEGTQLMFYTGAAAWELSESGTTQTPGETTLNLATSMNGTTWVKLGSNPLPVEAEVDGEIRRVAAEVVKGRIHLWVEDQYGDDTSFGYFLYEPNIPEHP
jgi:hypothetical protein